MDKRIILAAFLFITFVSCRNYPDKVPTGVWKYDLFMNGILLGEAEFGNRLTDNKYISTVKMEIRAGSVLNKTSQKTVETSSFEPVSLEIENITKTDNNSQRILTRAEFKKNNVTVDTGYNKATVRLPDGCMIDGNYFISELIKQKFAKGASANAKIFEPSVDIEEPVNVIVKVIGKKEISVRGKIKRLMHIVQAIENYKSVDMYLNNDGVVEKAVIIMLNNKMEIVLKQ